MLKKFLNKFKYRYAVLAILFVITAAFGFNHLKSNATADSCGNAPLTPAMNVWPLSYSNIDCHDLPLVDVKSLNGSGRDARYAQNQSEHNAGINVNPGDQVRVAIYFHNGASPDDQTSATAKNVVIASQIDTASGTSHNVSAAIGLDNGTPAYSIDADKGGDTKINSSVPTTLSYVPGSAKMCIREAAAQEYGYASAGSCGSGLVYVNVPDGVFNGGVNIGNVKACFDYSGSLIFTLAVAGQTQDTNTTLEITKQVRNVSQNGSFGPSTNAQRDENVEFRITVKNTGSVTAKNVIVDDPSVNGLVFVSGSNLTTGLPIGDLAPGATSSPLTFIAKYTLSSAQSNFANAKADNAPSVQAFAVVNPIIVTAGNPALQITKQVRNVSKGEASFGPSTQAASGETVEFQITVRNIGDANAQNVTVTDPSVSGLSFTTQNFNVGTLTPNQTSSPLKFTATFNSTSDVTNTATAQATGVNPVSAQAVVKPIIVTGNPTLQITKQVRDINTGTSFGGSTPANTGDTVEYQVIIKNIGNATANNVVFTDILPAGIALNTSSINGTPASGISLGNLAANTTAPTITYRATVNASSGHLVNTATASATNAASVTAQAAVDVTAPANRTLTITKQVRDLNSGSGFASSVNALNGDTVQYQIVVTNTGNATINNVRVNDTVPAGLNLVANTFNTNLNNGSTINNITAASLNAGQQFIITYNATVNLANPVCGTVVNTASVTGDQATQTTTPNPTATVNVVCNVQNGSLTVTKQVRNVTTGGSFSGSATANMGERLRYEIRITANNGNVNNVTLNEALPANTTYVSGSATLNNSAFNNNNFLGTTVNLGNLTSGQSFTFDFDVTVNNNLANCQTINIPNTVNVSGDNLGTFPASANVTVNTNTNSCNTFPQMRIDKQVRNASTNTPNGTTSFQESVSASQNDRVTFQIIVTNTGTQTLNNVWVSDVLPNGLTFQSNSVRLDGNTSSDQLINNKLYVGSMTPGQQHTVTFDVTVNSGTATTLTNTAQTAADNYGQIQDQAQVFISQVNGSTVNLSYSKNAFNDSKNIDATVVPANIDNTITYTLRVNNSGNAPATNFVVSDDLSQVLNYAQMIDLNGATLNGNVISWPAETVPAFGSVTHTFKVRVKSQLPAGSLQMVNTYGNTVVVKIAQPVVLGAIFVAPKTGASATVGLIFAALITAAIAIANRKNLIPKVRFE